MADPNQLSRIVIGAALRIHTKIGPGVLESVYQRVLAHDLVSHGYYVELNKPVSFEFEGHWFYDAFRADLVVERVLVVEVKSVSTIAPVHQKQLLTYLRLMNCELGLLINFGAEHLKDGIKRVVNGLK